MLDQVHRHRCHLIPSPQDQASTSLHLHHGWLISIAMEEAMLLAQAPQAGLPRVLLHQELKVPMQGS